MATEIPSIHVRPATFGIAAACGQVVALIITLATPYLQDVQYANLGAKIGFICMYHWPSEMKQPARADVADGGFSVAAVVFVYFLVPELKGRALEEIDWMYANGIPVSLTACIANGLIGGSYLPDPPNGLLQGAGSHKERHRCLEDRREGRQRGGGRHWDAVARGRESHGMDSDTQQVRVNRGIRTSAYRGPAGGDSWV